MKLNHHRLREANINHDREGLKMIRSKVNHEYLQKVMRVSTKHLNRDMSTA